MTAGWDLIVHRRKCGNRLKFVHMDNLLFVTPVITVDQISHTVKALPDSGCIRVTANPLRATALVQSKVEDPYRVTWLKKLKVYFFIIPVLESGSSDLEVIPDQLVSLLQTGH